MRSNIRTTLRMLAAAALGTALSLASLGGAAAQQQPEKQGLFGTVQAVADGAVKLETKQGPVDLAVTADTDLRTAAKTEVMLTDIKQGTRVAALARRQDSRLVALKVMLVPERTVHDHVVGTVVAVSGATVTLQDRTGAQITVTLSQPPSPEVVGDLTVFIGRRAPEAFKAEAEVKVQQIVDRLERHLDRAQGEIQEKTQAEAEAVAQAKDKATAQAKARAEEAIEAREEAEKRLAALKASLEATARAHIEVLEQVLQRVPEQARPALRQAIEASQKAQAAALEALAKASPAADARAMAEAHGTIEAVDVSQKRLTLTLKDGASRVLTVTDDTIIRVEGALSSIAALQPGSQAEVRFDPETGQVERLNAQAQEVRHVEATVKGVDLDKKEVVLELADGATLTVKVSDTTVIMAAGALLDINALAVGSKVGVNFNPQSNEALRLTIQAPRTEQEARGTIKSIYLPGSRISFVLDNGSTLDLKLTSTTKVRAAGTERTDVAQLKPGVEAEFRFNTTTLELLTLEVRKPRTQVKIEVRGTIQAVNTTAGELTIELPDGTTRVVKLSDITTYRVDGRAARAADLRPGMRLAVELADDGVTVLLVDALSRAEPRPEATGVVQTIDLAAALVIVRLDSGGVLEVKVAPQTAIRTEKGPSTIFDLRPGAKVALRIDTGRPGNIALSIEVLKGIPGTPAPSERLIK